MTHENIKWEKDPMRGQEWSLINRFMRFQGGERRPDFCVTPHSGDECAEKIHGCDVMQGKVEILMIFFLSSPDRFGGG